MFFRATPLAGAFVVELDPRVDQRGLFARTFCEREFSGRALATRYPQGSLSWSRRAGTLRGMHWQAAPRAEAKLVRCTSGAIYDVIVDLRRASPTCLHWFGIELTARNRWTLYVPEGFAHGFLTLADESEVSYWMSESHAPEAARGLRFDDPRLAIAWPAPPSVISERDLGFPDFEEGVLYEDPT